MDALALLCNLHADGPATLRLLRRAGLRNLSDIDGRAPESIAEVLGVSPAYARRFKREAGLLVERVGASTLDTEESGVGEMSALAATTVEELEPRSLLPGNPLRHARDAWPSSRWAAKTATVAPVRTLAGVTSVRAAPHESKPTSANPAAALHATLVPEAGVPLRAGSIEGLDARVCDLLIAQGVRSLEALVESTGLKLAKKIEVPYTRLLEFQWLATRALADRAAKTLPADERAAESQPIEEASRDARAYTAASQAPRLDPRAPAHNAPAPARNALEPIFILHPSPKPEPASILSPRATLGAAERVRARAPMREEFARDGRGAFAPDREFGPRITDSEVAGPFA